MKAFKAFIKPFEAPQRNVKIKIYVYFFSSSEIRMERANITCKVTVLIITLNISLLVVRWYLFKTPLMIDEELKLNQLYKTSLLIINMNVLGIFLQRLNAFCKLIINL